MATKTRNSFCCTILKVFKLSVVSDFITWLPIISRPPTFQMSPWSCRVTPEQKIWGLRMPKPCFARCATLHCKVLCNTAGCDSRRILCPRLLGHNSGAASHQGSKCFSTRALSQAGMTPTILYRSKYITSYCSTSSDILILFNRMLFHWVFIPWLQRELDNYKDHVNRSRKQHDCNKVSADRKSTSVH